MINEALSLIFYKHDGQMSFHLYTPSKFSKRESAWTNIYKSKKVAQRQIALKGTLLNSALWFDI